MKSFFILIILTHFLFPNLCYSNNINSKAPVSILIYEKIITTFLEERCFHFGSDRNINSFKCALASKKMIKDMQISSNIKGTLAIWHDELVSLIAKPEISQYLTDLEQELSNHEKQNHNFNLWNFTMEYNNFNFEQSLKYIAVLFQDTSEHLQHIKLLKAKYAERFKSEIFLLENVCNRLRVSTNVDMAPYDTGFHFSNPYHFYVIAYLAHRLSTKNNIKNQMSVWVPFMLNTLYEFIQINNTQNFDVRNNLLIYVRMFKTAMRVPKIIDETKFAVNLRDIYLGYAGAVWGINGEKTKLNFLTFNHSLSIAPDTFMKKLFSDKIPGALICQVRFRHFVGKTTSKLKYFIF